MAVDSARCTACGYCLRRCPMKILIPERFAVLNGLKSDGNLEKAREAYQNVKGAKASQCIKCGRCEAFCPEHLPIIVLLEEVTERLERSSEGAS